MSWDSTYDNANQRWYAGIDVSDSYAWKLANPIAANFNNEEFGRLASGGNPAETKLKIDTSGNATFLGNLTSTAGGLTLNTNKFTVAGATGNTVIAGSLNIGGAFDLSVSGSSKFSVDVSGNVTNSGTLNSTGKIKTFDDLEVVRAATVGSTLGVTSQVTAPSFKVKDATNESLLLRAPGTAAALTKAELDAAAGFTIQPPVTNSTLPNGNSIQLKAITFDGNGSNGTRTFALQKVDNDPFIPISAANLLVSVGGVIQRPNTDYTVSGSNITFPASAWTNPPASGLSCFIIAFGGLGGLTQNQDWDGVKGVLLVGSATDNLGIKLGVGSNNQILTADSTTTSGLAWKSNANLATNIVGGVANQIPFQSGQSATTFSANLTFNGTNLVCGGTITANSDEKLKKNVITIENALEKVLSLRGVEYDRIDSRDHQIGVIAQEVEKVVPAVVYGDEIKSVAYGNLVGLLIEAIKEQQKEIDELKKKFNEEM
jgi:hypothetical protein